MVVFPLCDEYDGAGSRRDSWIGGSGGSGVNARGETRRLCCGVARR